MIGMQWFEDEAFWRTFYPVMFDENRYAAAVDEVDRVIALSGVASGSVLDLCCGPGRHSQILAQRGFQVTGVDRSPFLLDKARERTAGSAIEFVEADMREFVREGAFDLALSLFTSFGYFEARDEDLVVLQNLRSSLKKGGVFLIDVISKERLASLPCRTRWQDLDNGDICVQHCEILPGWSRARNRWLLVSKEQTARCEFSHQIYSGQELTALLERAGFSEIKLYGSLDGAPYDSAATRLVARARVG
jgi:SAM-dependent methyltransferase